MADLAATNSATTKIELELNKDYICPITHSLMQDPVLAEDGISYERSALSLWLLEHATLPYANTIAKTFSLHPNVLLRTTIVQYLTKLSPDQQQKIITARQEMIDENEQNIVTKIATMTDLPEEKIYFLVSLILANNNKIFITACKTKNLSAVKFCLRFRNLIENLSAYDNAALLAACSVHKTATNYENDMIEIVKLLLANQQVKAKIAAKNNLALQLACEQVISKRFSTKLVQILLSYPEVTRELQGHTTNPQILECILKESNNENLDEASLQLILLAKNDSQDYLYPGILSSCAENNQAALRSACKWMNDSIVEILLERGATPTNEILISSLTESCRLKNAHSIMLYEDNHIEENKLHEEEYKPCTIFNMFFAADEQGQPKYPQMIVNEELLRCLAAEELLMPVAAMVLYTTDGRIKYNSEQISAAYLLGMLEPRIYQRLTPFNCGFFIAIINYLKTISINFDQTEQKTTAITLETITNFLAENLSTTSNILIGFVNSKYTIFTSENYINFIDSWSYRSVYLDTLCRPPYSDVWQQMVFQNDKLKSLISAIITADNCKILVEACTAKRLDVLNTYLQFPGVLDKLKEPNCANSILVAACSVINLDHNVDDHSGLSIELYKSSWSHYFYETPNSLLSIDDTVENIILILPSVKLVKFLLQHDFISAAVDLNNNAALACACIHNSANNIAIVKLLLGFDAVTRKLQDETTNPLILTNASGIFTDTSHTDANQILQMLFAKNKTGSLLYPGVAITINANNNAALRKACTMLALANLQALLKHGATPDQDILLCALNSFHHGSITSYEDLMHAALTLFFSRNPNGSSEYAAKIIYDNFFMACLNTKNIFGKKIAINILQDKDYKFKFHAVQLTVPGALTIIDQLLNNTQYHYIDDRIIVDLTLTRLMLKTIKEDAATVDQEHLNKIKMLALPCLSLLYKLLSTQVFVPISEHFRIQYNPNERKIEEFIRCMIMPPYHENWQPVVDNFLQALLTDMPGATADQKQKIILCVLKIQQIIISQVYQHSSQLRQQEEIRQQQSRINALDQTGSTQQLEPAAGPAFTRAAVRATAITLKSEHPRDQDVKTIERPAKTARPSSTP